ncbi:hypothetical protein [Chlamydia vaughanii]|uniref:hypothetical protein n=1 Tax=Chlamydia vaughanii TaxID=3112552 RepID=UPI0032B22373
MANPISQEHSKKASFDLLSKMTPAQGFSRISVRIISVVILILSLAALSGSIVGLMFTLNICFIFLAAFSGILFSMGILVNFILPTKKAPAVLP